MLEQKMQRVQDLYRQLGEVDRQLRESFAASRTPPHPARRQFLDLVLGPSFFGDEGFFRSYSGLLPSEIQTAERIEFDTKPRDIGPNGSFYFEGNRYQAIANASANYVLLHAKFLIRLRKDRSLQYCLVRGEKASESTAPHEIELVPEVRCVTPFRMKVEIVTPEQMVSVEDAGTGRDLLEDFYRFIEYTTDEACERAGRNILRAESAIGLRQYHMATLKEFCEALERTTDRLQEISQR